MIQFGGRAGLAAWLGAGPGARVGSDRWGLGEPWPRTLAGNKIARSRADADAPSRPGEASAAYAPPVLQSAAVPVQSRRPRRRD